MDKSKTQTNRLKKIRINKTKKNNNSTNIYTYYDKNFFNTPLIPNTEIIRYIFNGYKKYQSQRGQRIKTEGKPLSFDEMFKTNNDFPPSKVFSIEKPIESTGNLALNDFIAFSFYVGQRMIFEDLAKNNSKIDVLIEKFKYQIGKDISRDNRTINGKEYPSTMFSSPDPNYYAEADKYYKILIDYYSKVNKKINYDILNKISLLSCQNSFNLLTDIITSQVHQMILPEEASSVFRPTKSIDIIMNENEITFQMNFKSQILLTRDLILDPEYADCATLDFKLLIDLKNNTYKFSMFKLKYDINKCGPHMEPVLPPPQKPKSSLFSRFTRKNKPSQVQSQEESSTNQNNNSHRQVIQDQEEPQLNLSQEEIQRQMDEGNDGSEQAKKDKKNSKLVYLIPALGVTGALVATPFLLGVLGGSKTRKRRHRR